MGAISRNGDSGVVVTIDSGETESSVFDARDGITFGIITPSALTGSTFTFEVAPFDGAGFTPLNDETGAAVTLAVAADNAYTLPAALAPWPYFRLVSGATEGADRDIRVVRKG